MKYGIFTVDSMRHFPILGRDLISYIGRYVLVRLVSCFVFGSRIFGILTNKFTN